MIVYHHRGGSCCTIDYNPPKQLLCLWESTLRAPPQLLSLCNYTIRPDCRLKVIIDQGVLMAHGPPGAHSAAASSFLCLCCLLRDKQCSWVENPSDLTGPLSTNTKVFSVLWTLLSIRVSPQVRHERLEIFMFFFFFYCLSTDREDGNCYF